MGYCTFTFGSVLEDVIKNLLYLTRLYGNAQAKNKCEVSTEKKQELNERVYNRLIHHTFDIRAVERVPYMPCSQD